MVDGSESANRGRVRTIHHPPSTIHHPLSAMLSPASTFWLVCPRCGTETEAGARWWGCEACRDAAGFPHWLEVRYDLERIDPAPFRRAGRVWDYAPLLPARRPE